MRKIKSLNHSTCKSSVGSELLETLVVKKITVVQFGVDNGEGDSIHRLVHSAYKHGPDKHVTKQYLQHKEKVQYDPCKQLNLHID